MRPDVQRVDAWRLRDLLQLKLYGSTFIGSSVLGGWFLCRDTVKHIKAASARHDNSAGAH
jgi:hypothetical protein